jgi:RNA polymerase sigma factor (sigma-70 family)
MSPPTPAPQPAGRDWFRTTHWSVVLAASQADGTRAAEALETLCRAYWYPVYAYTRRRGYEVEEAQDLTQEFFVRLLEKNWLGQADRDRGRFRSFLLSALKNFLANEWRRSHQQKRGGGRVPVSLDDTAEVRYLREPACEASPDKDYERRWALTLFDRALERLRGQYGESDKGRTFELLQDCLWQEGSEAEYQRVGEQLGLTVSAVSSAAHRMRQRYRELVREEITQTVDGPSEAEEEMRWLLSVLSS